MPIDSPIIEYFPTIKELPEGERPRERLEHYGAGALSSAELLAIILRVGTKDENVIRLAQRLLTTYGGLAGLAQAPFSELVAIKGLGQAKATRQTPPRCCAARASHRQIAGRCG
jgi:DNA repair protein RadC